MLLFSWKVNWSGFQLFIMSPGTEADSINTDMDDFMVWIA